MNVDSEIDSLYQLPLDQFTPARNALAKSLTRADVKTLEKPTVPAWAVNQLYWHEREIYDRLIEASERLRAEHRKLLGGKAADIKGAEKVHRDVIREGIDRIKALLESGGQAATAATLSAAQETLGSLPSSDAPGRLVRPLKPMGFEGLSGVTVRPALRVVSRADTVEPSTGRSAKQDERAAQGRKREQEEAKARAKAEAERQKKQREAEQALKAAEAAMLDAEAAVKNAEKALGELKLARDAAVRDYQRARLKAHQS